LSRAKVEIFGNAPRDVIPSFLQRHEAGMKQAGIQYFQGISGLPLARE